MPRRPVVTVIVAALVGALSVVVGVAGAAQAAPGDQIAPVTAPSATTYAQAFARADGTVNATYTLAGAKLSQNATPTALMNTRGSTGEVFSPAGVLNSTGALINNAVTANCAGGNGTATDCGTSGTITIAFDTPVTNPTIHLAGLGGSQSLANGTFANFASYFNLTGSASSTAAANSATFGALLGTPTNLELAGGRLQTTGLRPSASCDNVGTTGATSAAGCGSVQINGTNLTSITLTVGLRNSGAGIDLSQATGTVQDAFLLTTSIPDVAPSNSNFQCTANSIYGVDQNDWNVNQIDVNTGAETFVGHIAAAAGTDLNGLAITNGGTAAYAIKRTVTPGGPTTIYRLDPTNNTTQSFAGPNLTQTTSGTSIVEGAVDPANGIYYFSLIGGSGVEFYGFNTNTNTPIVGRIAHLSGFSGTNGDFAFDRVGRLILTSSKGDGSATANPLIYVNQPLPSTGNDATLAGEITGYLSPANSIINGMAFDLAQGYLYTNSSTGGQSVLHQVNPTSGADVATHPVSYLGQPTNEVFDLGSCNYNNSIELQKDVVGRVAATDQFTVAITGGGINVAQTGTTSGTATGVQTSVAATAGPIPTLAGTTYTIAETASGTTNLANYISTWKCVNLLDPNTTLVSGTGTTGSVTFPTPTSADGIPLGCYFRNEPIQSSIAITKTTNQTVYHVGDTVTYTIKVTNTGNSALTAVAVADPADAACTKTIGALASGASTTYTCTATAPVTGNSNTANVSGVDPLNKTVTATSTVPVTTIRPALTLTKTASPATITAAGQVVTYSFVVTNSGDAAVTAIAIADTATAPGGVPATITCPLTTLAAGASTTCTGTYTATQADVDAGTIKDSAVANGKDPLNSTVTSNAATATVTVTQTGSITVTKTATPTTISAVGQTVAYAFTVRNTGNVTITNIVVNDVFDNPAVVPPAITCPSTSIAPGASVRCTATYTSTQADFDQGSINNTATATGKNPTGGTVTAPPSSASVTATVAPSISLVKTALPTTVTAAGQTVNYSFKVTNTGNQTVKNLTIADTFTAPAAPALAVSCPVTTLAPGVSTTCTATYTATLADVNAGSIKNAAVAKSTTNAGTPVNSAESDAVATVTQRPTLTVVKTANPTTVTAANQTVAYSFLVTNTGNVTVSGISVNDAFATPAGPNPVVNCPLTTLIPGASTTCTATYTTTQADVNNGTIKNTANAIGLDPNGAAVSSPPASATVTVTRTSSLQLVKSATPTTVTAVNQSVVYTFAVTNTGNQTLTGLSIADTFTAPAGPPLAITCTATSLAPGASTSCTGTYKTTQADLDNGVINNTAVAKGVDPTAATITSNTSTAAVTATNSKGLTLTKTANPTVFTSVNQAINYSFVVTNSGNVTVSAIAVADPMFTGAAAPTCPVTTLAPGASTTCSATHLTTQADLDAGRILNTATANGKDPKGATVTSNTAAATVTATVTSSLSLVKSVSPGSVTAAGNTVTYSFLVTNTGNVTITGLAVNDVFTAPAGPVPAISCPLTTLAPNASTTCTSSAYTATQADINNGSINNSATATGRNPANATVTSNPSTASVSTTPTAKLTLLKSANPTSVTTAGSTVTYTFTVTNSGNVTVTGLTVADTFTAPAGPELTNIVCQATTLAPNATTTCSATYVATQADIDNGSIKNSATASGKSPTNTTITSNTSAATVTVPQTSTLSLVKTANPTNITAAGQTVAYTFTVRNTGNTTLANLAVADTFSSPAGPEITVNCPTAPLLPGATATCTATYTATQADVNNGSIKNSAVASAKNPAGATVVSPTANATVTVTRSPSLTVVKAANPTTVTAAGQVVNYSFTVTNTGNVTLSLLNVVDTLAAPSAPTPTVTCPGTTINPAQVVVCTAAYTVTQADIDNGSLQNTGVARATDPSGNPITSPPSSTSVGTTQTATLTLIKAASPTAVTTPGQVVTYTFTVKNTGTVTARALTINDTLATPAGPALAPITCNATTLAPGATTTCTASYTVTQADVDNGSIKNTATAAGTDPKGNPVASNSSAAVVTATANPTLTLTKSATPATYTAAGQTVTYTFTVKNTGNVTVTAVAIADAMLGAPATCLATTLAAGATTTCTGTHTVTQADVDNGSIVNTATASAKSPAGVTVTSPPASATVTSAAAGALTLTKTANPTTITAAGQTVVYTFVVTNTSAVTIHGITITDRFVAPAAPVPTITCAATSLAPNASTTCTSAAYTATQADVDKGSVVNTANANGLDPANAAVTSPVAGATVTVTQTPALTLVKSVNPTTASRAGQAAAYTFVVTNTGNVTVSGLTVADTFTAPAAPALAVSCPVTTLAPNATTTCTATYAITQADVDAGSVRNSAIANAKTPAGAAVASPPSAAAITIAAGPALALVKSAAPLTFTAPGQTVVYSFKVTNTGTVTASTVAITDPMFTGAAAPVCPVTTLAPNASTTCTATYVTTQADVDAGTVVNTATATGTAPGGARIVSPPSTATVTATQTPSLRLVKAATPQTVTTVGQIVNYTLTVTNTGNTTITNLTVTDAFTAPAVNGATVNCPQTTLLPGGTAVCLLSYNSTADDFNNGTITNTATAHGTSGPGATPVDSNPSSAVVTAQQTPGLSLVKSANPTTVTTVGQPVTYTFTVTNNGTVTVHALTVVDTLAAPAGPEVVASCVTTTLAAGATTTCTATYATTQADLDNGVINNSATVNGLDPGNAPITSPPSTASVQAVTTGTLALTKTAAPTTLTGAGGIVTYTFKVTNTGTTTIRNVVINDPHLVGTAAAVCAGGTPTAGPTLAPGASVTCTGTYTATVADANAGSIVNVATANGQDTSGKTVTSPTATATVTIPANPALTVVKSVTSTGPVNRSGQTITYSFVVTNSGNVTVAGVAVVDQLVPPAGPAVIVTCPPNASLAPGNSLTCTASYTTTQADVDNGSVGNSATANGTTPGGATVTSPPSTATVPVTRTTSLTLVKTASVASATVGTRFTYSFAVTNTSNVTITNLSISDVFDAPATPALNITCPVTTLLPGGATTCTANYTVKQADGDKGSVGNTATATGLDPAARTVTSNPSSATVTVPQASQLTLVKSADQTVVTAVGQVVNYSFKVTNTGTVTVTGLSIADTFAGPAGPPLAVTCPVTTLAPSVSTTCTAAYSVTQADLDQGSIKNSAVANGKNPAGATVTSAPSTATVSATQSASLSLAKSAAPTSVSAAGTQVTYSFKVTNTGTVTVNNVAVTDTFTPPAGPVPAITCPQQTLLPGASTTCTATYTVKQADIDAGSIKNAATASGTDPANKPVTSNQSTAVVTTNAAPALSLQKTASPTAVTAAGTTVSYQFVVRNTGNVTVSNIVVADTLTAPAGPALAVSCPVTSLAPNATTTCTASYVVTQADLDAGSINNTATATGRTSAGTAVPSNPSTATVTVAQAQTLTLLKTASPTTITAAGQPVTYSFKVTNTGNTTVSSLTISDVFTQPAGPALAITCPQTTLAPGATTTCTGTYQSTQADVNNGRIDNRATAVAQSPSGQTVTSNESAASVTVPRTSGITVVKTASISSVSTIGRAVTYSFKVTNTGNTTLTGIAVTDQFTAPAGPELAVNCPVTTLLPGASTTCTANYTVTAADIDKGSVINTATATGTDPSNTKVTSAPSTATITANPQPSVALVKKATVTDVNNDGVTDLGDTIRWTFTVTNTGNDTLSGVVVNDAVAGSVTCPASSLPGGASETCSADVPHVISQADVDAGSVNNTATASGTDPFNTQVTSLPSSTSTPITVTTGLSIVKTAAPTTISGAGQTVTYTFRVTNTGTQTITGIAVADTFTAPAAPALVITCPQTTLGAGAFVDCTAPYTTTQADVNNGVINNSATASGKNPAGGTVTSQPSTATVTATRTPTLTLVKTAAPTVVTAAGNTVTYSFKVTNTGNVTVSGITIADTFTAPAAPALTVACPDTTLLPGASTTCTGTYTVTQRDVDNGSIKNTAIANGTNPQGGPVASNQAQATVTANPAGALTLVKSATPTTVTTVGQPVTYSFVVTNSGNVTIANVAISDTFTAPAGPALVITCPAGPLAPGRSATCTAPYAVTQLDLDRGAIDNRAFATGSDPSGTVITSNTSTATIGTTTTPTLTIVKSAVPTTVTAANQSVAYSFLVTNTGNVTVSALLVNDTFTAPAGPVPTIQCPTRSLAPGASTTCTAIYTTTQLDIDKGSIVNTATASGVDPTGKPVVSSPSTSTVTAPPAATLTVVKTATPTTVTTAGDRVTYRFAVTNTGNVTVTSLVVNDTLAAPAGPALGITCPVATLAPGGTTVCTGTYTVTQADLDSGAINNSATVSGTTPAGAAITSPPSTATVTASPTAALTVRKTASPQTVTAAGQTVTYSFLVTNNGTVTISGIAINDTFVSPAGPALVITCQATTLAPAGTTTCTANYTVTQADLDKGTIVNSATASGTKPGGGTITSSPSTATVNAGTTPALTVVKTATPTTVNAVGQTVTYTFAVTNTGNATVTGITIADQLAAPAGPALTASCLTSTLAPAGTTTCTASYTVTQADLDNGSIGNTATAAGSGPGGILVTSPPSSATVTATRGPALTVVKSATPTTITAVGQTVTYSFLVTNTGNQTVTGIAVDDQLATPAGPAVAVSCLVTTLAPGGTTTCTATYRVTQADVDNGSVSNTATVAGKDPSGATTTSPPSTATVPVTQGASLTVVKTASPTSVTAAGQPVVYSFRVTNTGNVTINNLSVTDTFTAPAGPTLAISCPQNSLAGGASITCTGTYTTTQADIDAGTIKNSATVSGNAPNGTGVTSPPSTATVTAGATPTLTVLKTATPQTVTAAGQRVTYTFVVTNTGNVSVSGIAIADTFTAPAAPALVIGCQATTLAPNASTTCTGSYTTTQADIDKGTIVNTATATGTAAGGTPIVSPPSTATVTATTNPNLTLVKSASPATVSTLGQTVNYSFKVTNTGNTTVDALTVDDQLAAPAGPALTVTCPVTSLLPGDSTTCTAPYTVTQADLDKGVVANSATARATLAGGGSVTSNPSTATVPVNVNPDLTVVKTASPTTVSTLGQTVTYTVAVTNTGNQTITKLTVADVLATPAGPAITVPCPQAPLAPGATVLCKGTYTVTQADLNNGSISNTATATGNDPSGNPTTSPPSTATVAVDQTPTLTLVKAATPTTVGAVGDKVAYTFVVTNTGNVSVTNVAIADTFTAPAAPAVQVSCPDTTLAPKGQITCTATYTVTQADVDKGSIVNTATASGTDPNGAPVTSPPSTATVTVTQKSALTVVKTATPTTVTALGQTVTYSFLVTNTGNTTITGIAIADTFTAPAGPVPTISCPLTALTPGGTTTCTANYTVKQADLDAGSIVNTATAAGTDPSGTTVTSPQSGASVAVDQTPALSLTKTAAPTVLTAAGQTVTYTFTVTNTGNATVGNLAIQDTFTAPAGPALTAITCQSTTLAPTATTTCTATYTATQRDIDNGGIVNTAVAAGTDPRGGAVTSDPAGATVTVTRTASLTLAKTATPTTVTAAGATVTYSFLVTNTGNTTVSGITVADTFTAPAAPALGPITCPATTLAPAATTTCTATYTVTQLDVNAGTITNTATVSGTPAGSTTPVRSDPSTATVTATQTSGLTVRKTSSAPAVTSIGQVLTYSFLVTNTGNTTVTGISINDTLTAPAGPAVTPTCPVTTLDPGKTVTCTATYTVTAADFDNGSIRNTATATGTPPGGTPITSPPSTVTVTATPLPALTIVKKATVTDVNNDGLNDLGDTILWTFLVTNSGNVTLTDVAVNDSVAGTVTCPQQALTAGAAETCTAAAPHVISQTDVDAGHVDNIATATGTPPSGQPVTSPPSAVTVQVGAQPALSLTKSGAVVDTNGNGRVDAGDTIVYTFAVTNTGNVTITGLKVTDAKAGKVTCPTTTLLVGGTTTCKADVVHVITQADIDAGSYTNTATAGGTAPDGKPVTSPPSTATVPLPGAPSLALVKSATVTDNNDNGINDAGDDVVWHFLVTNTGNVTVRNVNVQDPTAGTVTCPQATLAPGASETCLSAAHTITAAEAARGKLTNTATVTGTVPGGAKVTSPPSSATVTTGTAGGTGGAGTGSTGKGGSTNGGSGGTGGGPAYTGAKDLPLLLWVGLMSLLLGMMFLAAGLLRRRRHGLA